MGYRFRRLRARSLWREMAVRGLRALRELEDVLGVVNSLYTLAAFAVASLCAPLLLVLYCVVDSGRRACVRRLQRLHPELDVVRETTVRSALDTKRNQGVVAAVLQVKGRCDIARIKASLQEKVLDKKEADGRLSFPHLRMVLTSKSMLLVVNHYAWQPVTDFSLDNHMILGSNLFRGRPVSELNIQEYVSEVVSKYLPPELPPWQVVVIPCAGQEERYYLVVRLHHLLLSEDHLGLESMLQMEPQGSVPWSRRLEEDDENPVEDQPCSPLGNLSPQLEATNTLIRAAKEKVQEAWENFVQANDPLENVDVLKKRPSVQMFAAVFVIANVAVARRLFSRGDPGTSRLSRLFTAAVEEYRRRQCTPQFVWRAVVNSCCPASLLLNTARCALRLVYVLSYCMPKLLVQQLGSLSRCGPAPWVQRAALALAATSELWRSWVLVYTAPRFLLEDLFFSQDGPRHQLQTVSLCGRKVVAWSAPVPLDLVRRLAAALDTTPSEVLIAATAGALREYFRQLGLPTPTSVQCSARCLPRGPGAACGLVCLPLPMRGGFAGEDAAAGLRMTREAVTAARQRQVALHLLSSCLPEGGLLVQLLPSVLVRLLMNHVTRRYAVTLTEAAPQQPCHTIWGHPVEHLMYWRPPQSNICMALTLVQYGHAVRLGVMTDALLSPQQVVIANAFQQQVSELATAAGVPRDRVSTC